MLLSTVVTDDELVGAARRGDDRAFEELYSRYRQRIKAFASRMMRDEDRADDITQEIFISALRRLRDDDRPIQFRPWIYEIARNACIDEHRRIARTREVSIDCDPDGAWAGSSPPPEVVLNSKQLLDDLRGAFHGLSERHHRVIVLRELEGLTYSQIGDELGMSKLVVESTLFRARRRLTEEYDDLSSGRRCEYVQRLISEDRPRRWRGLGARDRRAMAGHLQHCGSCRREAREAGWENRAKPRLGKLAALLPIPLLRVPGRWADRLSALPPASAAAQYADPVTSIGSAGRAAATAATLIVAAIGGGIASDAAQHSTSATAPAISALRTGPVIHGPAPVTDGSSGRGGLGIAGAGVVSLHREGGVVARFAAGRSGRRASSRRSSTSARAGLTTLKATAAKSPTAPLGIRHHALGPAAASSTTTPSPASSLPSGVSAATGNGVSGSGAGAATQPLNRIGSAVKATLGVAAGANAGTPSGAGAATPSPGGATQTSGAPGTTAAGDPVGSTVGRVAHSLPAGTAAPAAPAAPAA